MRFLSEIVFFYKFGVGVQAMSFAQPLYGHPNDAVHMVVGH